MEEEMVEEIPAVEMVKEAFSPLGVVSGSAAGLALWGGLAVLQQTSPIGNMLVFGGAFATAMFSKNIIAFSQRHLFNRGVSSYGRLSEQEEEAVEQIASTLSQSPNLTNGLSKEELAQLKNASITEKELADLMSSFRDEDEDEGLPIPPVVRKGPFVFSDVLGDFTPALDKIYLGTTTDGQVLYCAAEDLCHVALAGSTGGGKSSTMRMLMAQLCKAGAQVLLLNPHYTRFDIKTNEDWTPFEKYLVHDPMECRKYEVIKHYLEYVAKTLLPRRLDKYAHSQPFGRPYFIVLDELPAITKRLPDAPEYLSEILREGRKVGIFLISASQDFLVKTLGFEGGAVRDCYRTAVYSGGDATTAKVLLDMPVKEIPEDTLGKGVVMLRCASTIAAKKAIKVLIPYVDNNALYRLLGPSTYHPTQIQMMDEDLPEPVTNPMPTRSIPVTDPFMPVQMARRIPADLQAAFQAYHPGMTTYHDLARAMRCTGAEARAYWAGLKNRRLIGTVAVAEQISIQLGKGVSISQEQLDQAIRLRQTGESTGYRDLMGTFNLSEHHAKVLNNKVREALAECESES